MKVPKLLSRILHTVPCKESHLLTQRRHLPKRSLTLLHRTASSGRHAVAAPVALDRNETQGRTQDRGQGFTTVHHKLGIASDTAGQEKSSGSSHSRAKAAALCEKCGVHKRLYQKAEDSRPHLNAGHSTNSKVSKGKSHTCSGCKDILLTSRFSKLHKMNKALPLCNMITIARLHFPCKVL